MCLLLTACLSLAGADEKTAPRQKARELLDSAAKMVTSSQPQVQVAALLHLGDNYNLVDRKKAQEYLEQAFAAAADLPGDSRGRMQGQVVMAMADVNVEKTLEMLPQLAASGGPGPDPRPRAAEKVVRLLLDKADFDRAIEIVDSVGSNGEYPFQAARLIFEKLPADDPRRVQVFGAATTAFIGRPRGPFAEWLTKRWREVPKPMAESALQAVLNSILDRKEDADTVTKTNISTARGAVSFTTRQDQELFQIMDVLRSLNAKRAEELIEARPELKGAVERFPLGMSSMTEGDAGNNVSVSAMRSNKGGPPQDDARERLNAIARARVAEALGLLKSNPQQALSLVRGIPLPAMRAEVLGSVARSVSEKDPATAKSVLDQTMEILKDIQSPGDRIRVWDIVAEAAHRAKEDQRAWEAIDRGLSDAAALYKQDTDVEAPNEALREYWPSTQSYRRLVSRAAKLFGTEAEPLLAKITDPDIALLARIEMARSLLGREASPTETQVSRSGGKQQQQQQQRDR